ncbi:hypothetical protein SUGI_0655810 [Cryptomeria japonica]|nr:hypothetical protein SUGI_0655810 [Cryptomeria japonica]
MSSVFMVVNLVVNMYNTIPQKQRQNLLHYRKVNIFNVKHLAFNPYNVWNVGDTGHLMAVNFKGHPWLVCVFGEVLTAIDVLCQGFEHFTGLKGPVPLYNRTAKQRTEQVP